MTLSVKYAIEIFTLMIERKASLSCLLGILVVTGSLPALADPPTPAQAATSDLSNQLPLGFVQHLMDEHHWSLDFEKADSPSAKDLLEFWFRLKDPTVEKDVIVDHLFGSYLDPKSGKETGMSQNYAVKYNLIQYLLSNPEHRDGLSEERLSAVYGAWQNRYITSALAMIEIPKISDLVPIVQTFKTRYLAGFYKIVDLTLAERQRLSSVLKTSHGVSITAIDAKTNRYLVSGLYNAQEHYLALDFSKPFEETLITFTHEMVHAADPRLDDYRKTYIEFFPKVLDLAVRWTQSEGIIDNFNLHDKEGFFFETDIKKLMDLSASLEDQWKKKLEQHIEELKKDAKPDEIYVPTQAELDILHQWIRASLGLRLENEYHAYGLSMLVYSALKDKFQILPPNPAHKLFLDAITAGDKTLIQYIQQGMPMPLNEVTEDLKGFNLTDLEPTDPSAKLFAKRRALFSSEFMYFSLEEKKNLQQRFADHYSSAIRSYSSKTDTNKDLLPDWAQPNGFELPTNPYKIMTAKVTTAGALHFLNNLDWILSDVKRQIEPLMSLSVGILDLHDVSLGQLKLIGIQFVGSPKDYQTTADSLPENFPPALREDIDQIPEGLKSHFDLVQWTPETLQTGSVIDGHVAVRNLLKLRLYTLSEWLNFIFPSAKGNVMGAKIFLEKLRESMPADSLDMTEKRKLEVIEQLIAALHTSSHLNDNIAKLKLLFAYVSEIYSLSKNLLRYDPSSQAMSDQFYAKLKMLLVFLDNAGAEGELSFREIHQELSLERQNFLKSLKSYRDDLSHHPASEDPLVIPPSSNESRTFSLGDYSFKMVVVRSGETIYGVRLPGDFPDYMTTWPESQGITGPVARILQSSRQVRLFPIDLKD